MQWRESYSVGIEEIDDHHKHLIELFARISSAAKQGRGWKEVAYGLADLKSFARKHFEFEESLMRMYGFPDSASHKESHSHFFERLVEIENQSIPKLAESELLQFLCDWLKTHIQGSDRKYADHILAGAPIVRSKILAIAAQA